MFSVNGAKLAPHIYPTPMLSTRMNGETITLTFTNSVQIVLSIPVAPYVLCQLNAALQLGIKNVTLVEEQHEVDVRKEFVGADGFPEEDRVFQAIHSAVFG